MSLHQLVLISNNSDCTQRAQQPGQRLSSCNTAADHLLASASNQLSPCVYIALRCSHCGDIRQALHAVPSADCVPCPECGVTSKFILLGAGFTRTQLPFHENHSRERMHWLLREIATVDGT